MGLGYTCLTLLSEGLVLFVACDVEVEHDLVCFCVVGGDCDLVAELLELLFERFDGVFGCCCKP